MPPRHAPRGCSLHHAWSPWPGAAITRCRSQRILAALGEFANLFRCSRPLIVAVVAKPARSKRNFVGWVERSETHPFAHQHQLMGFASLYPSYELSPVPLGHGGHACALPTLRTLTSTLYKRARLLSSAKTKSRGNAPCPFSKITSPSSRVLAPASGARSRTAMRARARG